MAVWITGGGAPQAGVQYLSYIESTGSQYINTGFVPNQDTKVVLDFILLAQENEYKCLIGATSSVSTNTDAFACFYYAPAGGFLYFYGTQQSIQIDTSASYNGRHTLILDKNVAQLDQATITINQETFETKHPLYIFASNYGSSLQYLRMPKMRLYSCQIYSSGQLVRDYAPALDKAGAVCLYDKVSKTYAYNRGDGDFIAG